MIEAIQVMRDVVIILAAVIITTVAVIVGKVVLHLARKAEDLRLFALNLVTGVVNPIKGALLAIGHGGHRKR